jgi:hypothetical protein
MIYQSVKSKRLRTVMLSFLLPACQPPLGCTYPRTLDAVGLDELGGVVHQCGRKGVPLAVRLALALTEVDVCGRELAGVCQLEGGEVGCRRAWDGRTRRGTRRRSGGRT